jgi:2-oxopent-4-enoate/cis-2-oxohex-4-enoate hydratase
LLSPTQIDLHARRLREARFSRRPIPPLTHDVPDLTVADAYRIQSVNVSLHMHDRGLFGPPARHVGHKVGLTSRAVQRQLGVDQPDYGCLLSDMVVEHGGEVPAHLLLQPRVEGEIAFVLGRDLAGPGITVADVLHATDLLLPSIEIIDSRIADWKITYPDTIADNASSGMLVLGGDGIGPRARSIELAGLALRKNGEVVSTGAGFACLGHPANAVAWLANTLGRLGRSLHAGNVILSGALGPVVPAEPGDHIEIENAGVGTASCTFARETTP